jgi:hypothetical protein
VIVDRLELTPAELEQRTGWTLKPEGLCRDDRCVPFPSSDGGSAATVDLQTVAAHLSMPLVHDEGHGLWALGPEAGGHVLESARLPEIVLADVEGAPFDFASLRGSKVMIAAWASW